MLHESELIKSSAKIHDIQIIIGALGVYIPDIFWLFLELSDNYHHTQFFWKYINQSRYEYMI